MSSQRNRGSLRYSKDFVFGLYKTMLRIRLVEESLVEPVAMGSVRCPCHLYSGQEAIATGVCAALDKKDYIFGNHRSHGHYIAKGGDMKAMVAEIFGRETGCSKGRGGSMHLIDAENGMMGGAPIVAGTISLALGAALASSIRGDGRVTVSFFGDGSTGEGVLYESLNFAALKRLPVVFVCENNLYSTHMPISECRPPRPIFEVAKPFGIHTSWVDGNDVLKVNDHARRAIDRCRRGEGPAFLECRTYRMRGHVGSDDNVQGTHTDIRPTHEIECWKKKDPIKRLERYLLSRGVCSRQELLTMHRDIEGCVREAHDEAHAGVDPNQGGLTRYVFPK